MKNNDAETHRSTFAENLRRIRNLRATTQQGLATLAGLTRVTIASLETGEHGASADTITALSRALDVTPNDLLLPPEDWDFTQQVINGQGRAEAQKRRNALEISTGCASRLSVRVLTEQVGSLHKQVDGIIDRLSKFEKTLDDILAGRIP